MTAMGIIGIILAGAFGLYLILGGLCGLVEKIYEEKRKTAFETIEHKAKVNAEAFTGVMENSMKMIPEAMKGLTKLFGEEA